MLSAKELCGGLYRLVSFHKSCVLCVCVSQDWAKVREERLPLQTDGTRKKKYKVRKSKKCEESRRCWC